MSTPELLTPTAYHVGEDNLPWADIGTIKMKVLQVRQEEALWVVRNQFAPGVEIQTQLPFDPVASTRKRTSLIQRDYTCAASRCQLSAWAWACSNSANLASMAAFS